MTSLSPIYSPTSSSLEDPFSSPKTTRSRTLSALNNKVGITPDYKECRINTKITPQVESLGRKSIPDVNLGSLKKKHLNVINMSSQSEEDIKCFFSNKHEQISYGKNDVTDAVIQYRKEHLNIGPGRNVAVIVFKDEENGQPVGSTFTETRGRMGQNPHSEMIAFDKLPWEVRHNIKLIDFVYTERKPCAEGRGHRNCAAKLNLLGPLKILYSFDKDKEAKAAIRKVVDYRKRKNSDFSSQNSDSSKSSQESDTLNSSLGQDSELPVKRRRIYTSPRNI